VTFKSSPDYENPSDGNNDNIYNITVTVSDGTNSDSKNFNISVLDIDDMPPVFHEPFSAIVDENQTFAIDLNVTDNNSSDIYYSISGVDADKFDVNASGSITFKSPTGL